MSDLIDIKICIPAGENPSEDDFVCEDRYVIYNGQIYEEEAVKAAGWEGYKPLTTDKHVVSSEDMCQNDGSVYKCSPNSAWPSWTVWALVPAVILLGVGAAKGIQLGALAIQQMRNKSKTSSTQSEEIALSGRELKKAKKDATKADEALKRSRPNAAIEIKKLLRQEGLSEKRTNELVELFLKKDPSVTELEKAYFTVWEAGNPAPSLKEDIILKFAREEVFEENLPAIIEKLVGCGMNNDAIREFLDQIKPEDIRTYVNKDGTLNESNLERDAANTIKRPKNPGNPSKGEAAGSDSLTDLVKRAGK